MSSSLATLAAGVALVCIARWAGRRRGTRWDSLVALRLGDVLLTEVIGAFLIGYGIGGVIAPESSVAGGPAVPRGRLPRRLRGAP